MLSGMEAPIFVFTLLLSVTLLDHTEAKYDLWIGLVAGLAFLARPEGALVVALGIPLRMVILGVKGEINLRRVGSLLVMMLIALLVVAPWVLFCLSTTGYPLPDTIYAKVHTTTPLEIAAWNRWWEFFIIQMPHLIIGGIAGFVLFLKGKPYVWVLPLALMTLYGVAFPYNALLNNARYLVPVFSFLLIAAIPSVVLLVDILFSYIGEFKQNISHHVKSSITWIVVAIMLILPMPPYYLFQASLFGNSVKNMNDQQVHIGIWLANNTPPDAVYAIHDAGAIRFFSNRTIIDLFGLVSPDIVHGNLNLIETLDYLRAANCNYFVFFDEIFEYYWTYLLRNAYHKLYTVYLPDNVISGRDTMSVYWINWTNSDYHR
jgi:hypothetical protein